MSLSNVRPEKRGEGMGGGRGGGGKVFKYKVGFEYSMPLSEDDLIKTLYYVGNRYRMIIFNRKKRLRFQICLTMHLDI